MSDKILFITLCFHLFGAGIISAELKLEQIESYLYQTIRSKIGDNELWDRANNGGYLVRFSADVLGDRREEDFLSNTMSMTKTQGNWSLFSDGKLVGIVHLSGISFIAIRDQDVTRFPYGYSIGAEEAFVIDQEVSNGRIQVEKNQVSPDQLQTLRVRWSKDGQIIKPKIEAILLADYVSGTREWKAVDLTGNDYVFYGDGHFVLKSDEPKLMKVKLTPEDALMRLGVKADESEAGSTASPLSQSTPSSSSKPPSPVPPACSVNKSPSERGDTWWWVAGVIVLVVPMLFVLKRRK